jgi:uncharacterized delta-60 repeat protein
LLSAGAIDPSFDGDGKAVTNFLGRDDAAFDVAVAPSGHAIAVGFATRDGNTDFAIAAYRTDGQLDSSFAGTGRLSLNAYIDSNGQVGSTNVPDSAYGVALQPDGRFVVAGTAAGNIAVVRINADGSMDHSFGVRGIVNTDFGNSESATRVVVQPDGKILIGGIHSTGVIGGYGDFLLARYTATGQLDGTFGSGGKVILDWADDTLRGIALQNDGRIVAAGTTSAGLSYEDIAVVRFNANGSLDGSFDGDGIRLVDFGSSRDYGRAVALQSDGKIVVAGYSFYGFTQRSLALVRFDGDGSLDRTFDGDGIVLRQYANVTPRAEDLAIQSNGRIVVAGIFQNDSDPWHLHNDFGVARFESNGAVDGSFGTAGVTMTDFGRWTADEARGIALAPNGAIVVAGHIGELGSGGQDFAVARYEGDAVTAPSAISGAVYADLNRNGLRNFGERGLRGWHIYVDLNSNGLRDANEPTTRTDTTGRYRIESVPAGTHTVRDGGTYGTPVWSRMPAQSVTVVAGQTATGRDFGYKPNTVRGTVYHDLNGNGRRDTGEPGLARQVVFMDYNVNERYDAGEPTRVTSATGGYEFRDLVLEEGSPFWGTKVMPPTGWRANSGQIIPNPVSDRVTVLDLWLVRS